MTAAEWENITDRVVAGALVRREVRVLLDLLGAPWSEHKGWTESTFVVTADRETWQRIHRAIHDYNTQGAR